jgi:hypothetical protein
MCILLKLFFSTALAPGPVPRKHFKIQNHSNYALFRDVLDGWQSILSVEAYSTFYVSLYFSVHENVCLLSHYLFANLF